MQGKEKSDENSELFKEPAGAALHHYAAKQDSSIKEALIKSLSDFATSIIMQDKEKDDANSELFKESFDAVLHNYAAKSDSSI